MGWAEGGSGHRGLGGRAGCGQRGPVARVRVGIEGAKRPFGCERSEPSCSGLGSAKRSAAERGPTSSLDNRSQSNKDYHYFAIELNFMEWPRPPMVT